MSSTQSYISVIVQKFAFAIRTSAGHTFLVSRTNGSSFQLSLSAVGLGCSLLGLLDPFALVVRCCSCLLQFLVSGFRLLLFCDGSRLDALLWFWHWNNLLQGVLRHILQLRTRGVTLFHALCARLLGEQQQLGHVKFQSFHIGLETLGTSVASAMVHCDANGLGKFPGDVCFFQLIQSETFAQSHLHVVALCWRVHQWTKQSSRWTRKDLGCLFFASVCSTLLAASLVQPGSHENPVVATGLATIDLSEVHIGNDIVASVPHGDLLFSKLNLPLCFEPSMKAAKTICLTNKLKQTS